MRHTFLFELEPDDISSILAGNHFIMLLRDVMQGRSDLDNVSDIELKSYLDNAEFFLEEVNNFGFESCDLKEFSSDIYDLTSGMTDIDGKAELLVELVGKRKGITRTKGLIKIEKPMKYKRKTPLLPGVKYADPEHKAFPLDTPGRVRAAHAYIHKYWNSPSKGGVTASYNRKKFIQVHKRILKRMKNLDIDHNIIDSLDVATKKATKVEKKAKEAEKVEKVVDAPKVSNEDVIVEVEAGKKSEILKAEDKVNDGVENLPPPPRDRQGSRDGQGIGKRDGSGRQRGNNDLPRGRRAVGHRPYRGDCITDRNGKCYQNH